MLDIRLIVSSKHINSSFLVIDILVDLSHWEMLSSQRQLAHVNQRSFKGYKSWMYRSPACFISSHSFRINDTIHKRQVADCCTSANKIYRNIQKDSVLLVHLSKK